MANWGEFDEREPAKPAPSSRLTELCALVFTTPAGKELMTELRARVFDAVAADTAPEEILRSMNARRGLIRDLERLTATGLADIKPKT